MYQLGYHESEIHEPGRSKIFGFRDERGTHRIPRTVRWAIRARKQTDERRLGRVSNHLTQFSRTPTDEQNVVEDGGVEYWVAQGELAAR